MSRADIEILRRMYARWEKGDFSEAGIFDPDVESVSVGDFPETGTSTGYEAMLEALRRWLSAWERPFTVKAEEFIEAGDRVLVMIRWHGRGKGSGVEVEAEGAHVWTFRDGKIVRWEIHTDRDEARRSAGLDPRG